MKDENDNATIDFVSKEERARQRKHKRLPGQSPYRPPAGAKPLNPDSRSWPTFDGRSVVPVSSVAREWGITARRVRKMLEEGRLEGCQLENGYWEVHYPYRYILGTRGPAIKRQRDLPAKPKKPEPKEGWWK